MAVTIRWDARGSLLTGDELKRGGATPLIAPNQFGRTSAPLASYGRLVIVRSVRLVKLTFRASSRTQRTGCGQWPPVGSRERVLLSNPWKKTAVFGLYPSIDRAERAVDELVAARFDNADVSVLIADNQSSKDFAHEKQTKAPEGATTGVTAGGTLGGTLGLLAGIGALAIPGVGPFIAAGPIMGALAGIGVGGAVGGLVGALVGMGIPEYEAKRYEGRVKEGGVLLSVHCDTSDDITRAKDMLKRTGGNDIASAGEETVGATSNIRNDRTH